MVVWGWWWKERCTEQGHDETFEGNMFINYIIAMTSWIYTRTKNLPSYTL